MLVAERSQHMNVISAAAGGEMMLTDNFYI